MAYEEEKVFGNRRLVANKNKKNSENNVGKKREIKKDCGKRIKIFRRE